MAERDVAPSEAERRLLGTPDVPRRVRLPWQQAVGILALAAIPVLAGAGVIGPREGSKVLEGDGVRVELTYPEVIRFLERDGLTVDVTNTSGAPLAEVEVGLPPSYVDLFTEVSILPAPERPYAIALRDLAPGERRRVDVDWKGKRYGKHDGEVRVAAEGRAPLVVGFETVILP